MSIVTTLDVLCDFRAGEHARTGCGRFYRAHVGIAPDPSRDKARAAARAVGWARTCATTRHEYDLCPVHADDVPGATFPNWKAPAPSATPIGAHA